MTTRLFVILAFAAFSFWSCGSGSAPVATRPPYEMGLDSITVEKSRLYVETLANDSFEGRLAGTAGLTAAAQQIVAWLEEIGVEPLEGDSYFQIFDTAQIQELGILSSALTSENGVLRRTPSFEAHNIMAKIEGVNPDEYIIVGAHYDHMGINPEIAGEDKILNGADDNASGAVGVLQIARAFMASGEKPQRTIIFAFWDAEEIGLVGSKCFVESFGNMDKVKAYFNLDMIGRNDRGTGSQMAYYSTDTIPYGDIMRNDAIGYNIEAKAVTDPDVLVKEFPKHVFFRGEGDQRQAVLIGNSDYAPFMNMDIPVYALSTGMHPDYHKVTDEADKIEWQKMTDISKLSYLTVYRLANPGAQIVYPVKDTIE